MKNWEGVVKFFRLRFFKSLFVLVPSCTLKIETMDVNTLSWCIELFTFNSSVITLNDILQDIRCELDLIKRPSLGFSLSCNLLLHGGQETLRIEETSHPEGWWSFFEAPVEELEVSI